MCRVGGAIWRGSSRSAGADGARRGDEAPQPDIFQRRTKWRQNRQRPRGRARGGSSARRIYFIDGNLFFGESPQQAVRFSRFPVTIAARRKFSTEFSTCWRFGYLLPRFQCRKVPEPK